MFTDRELSEMGVRPEPKEEATPAPKLSPEQRGWLVEGEPQF